MSRPQVLGAFNRALALETHHISSDPGLLFQQLQNRLQWEDEEVQAHLRSRANGAPGRRRAVIRLKTRQRESPALIATIGAHPEWANGCAIAVDGRYLISVGDDGMAKQWSRHKGQELRAVSVAPPGSGGYRTFQKGATCCALTPDGELAVCGGAQGTVVVWDPKTGSEVWRTSESAYSVNACAAFPDARRVLWARVEQSGRLSTDSVVRIRDTSGEERTIELHGEVQACAVSPDGTLVAVATYAMEGRVEVRNVRTGAPLWKGKHPPTATFELEGSGGEAGFPPKINDCAFTPDGAFLVTAGDDSKLILWNPRSGTCVRTLTQTPAREQTACAVSPDGEAIVSGTRGGALVLWHPGVAEPLATLEGHGDEVTACAVGPDGSFAASASRDGTVRVWDLDIARAQARARGG